MKFLRFFRREIRRTRKGYWYFKCRNCGDKSLPHYHESTAYWDKKLHTCPDYVVSVGEW